jgi:hypothetical protein
MKKKITTDQRQQGKEHNSGYRPRGSQMPPRQKPSTQQPPKQQPSSGKKGKKE